MTDREILNQLRQLDERGDIDTTSWEATFLESLLYKKGPDRPLTEAQRAKAIEIIEQYEKVEGEEGGQQSIIKLPPGMEKYFGRQKP